MSRSSSGFESSHLPSPDLPAHPLTLTSTSSSKTPPACLPCISTSLRPPKSSLTLPSPAKGRDPGGAIVRSQSCTELRRNRGAVLLRRSFSLTVLHKEQKRRLIHPQNWNLTPRMKTEESTQDTVNPQKPCEVMSPPSQCACSTFNGDTVKVFAPKQAETTQSTHLQLPPTVPAERPDHTLTTPSVTNPRPEPVTPQTACVYDYTQHVLPEETSRRSITASVEARRLKMKRSKKTSVNPVPLSSLIEERL